jgi:hypothetical protein
MRGHGACLLNSTIEKGVTCNDLGDEGLHPKSIFGDAFHQVVHHNFIVTFELAAESVGE